MTPAITPELRERAGKPVRLQLSRKKGFDLQAHSRAVNGLPAVNVARPTKWGNPYRIVPSVLLGWWDIVGEGFAAGDCSHGSKTGAQMMAVRFFELNMPIGKTASVSSLRSRNLACWCPLGSPCHADVLLELANGRVCEPVSAPPVGGKE